MSLVNLGLLVVGVVLIGVGGLRARGPYQRAQALRANEENLRRYENWRGGGRRTAADEGPSSAELMREELMGQVRRWGALAGVGFVLVLLGVLLRP